jgi:cytochrome c556
MSAVLDEQRRRTDRMFRKIVQALSLAVVLLFTGHPAAAGPASQDQRSTRNSASAQQPAASPLVAEMTMLDSVMRDMVSAIAQADGARVSKSINSLHETMERTQLALRAGTLSLPKNGDRLDDFQRSHDSFHAQIEALGRAGNQNNVEAMLMITKHLLESCVTCHRTFRK